MSLLEHFCHHAEATIVSASSHMSRNLVHMCHAAAMLSLFAVAAATCVSCKHRCTPYDTSAERRAVTDSMRAVAQRARTAAKAGNNTLALDLYRRCAVFSSTDSVLNDSLAETVSNVLVQMMNIYQVEGKPDACIEQLESIAATRTPLLQRQCRRDMAIITAYAMSRTEREQEAAQLMDKALLLPADGYTPNRLFRDYAYAAATYFCMPTRQHDVIRYGKMAIEQAHLCKNMSGIQWLTTMLGQLYERTGNITGAITMNRRAYDEACLADDTLAMANANCHFAQLLLGWMLGDRADRYASSALATIQTLPNANPMVLGTITITKAKTCDACDKTDSALWYLDKAHTYCGQLPYNSGQSDIDMLRGRILSHSADTAHYRSGIALLKKVVGRATPGIKGEAFFALAKAYIKHGNTPLGETCLDSVYAVCSASPQPLTINGAYEFALDHYLSVGNTAKISQYAEAVNRRERRANRRTALRNVAASVIKFDTERKENALRMQEQELRRRTQIAGCLVVLAITIAMLTLVFYRNRRKMFKLTQCLMEERLDNVTRELESVTQQLHRANTCSKDTASANTTPHMSDDTCHSSATTGNTQGDTQSGSIADGGAYAMSNADGSMIPQSVPQQYMPDETALHKPRVNDSDGEARFRASFTAIYPKFVPRLRTMVPGISRREELLAMLIVLGKDRYQIENILCIAHSSVNMARYRLRQKMQLGRNDQLDTFLRKILDE